MLEPRANEILKKYTGKKIWKIQSFSRPDQFHIVWQRDNGWWDCTCEYKSIHRSKTCDHIRKTRHQKMKWHGSAKKKKMIK